MLQEIAGEIAGKIWVALSENGELTGKELKKVITGTTTRSTPITSLTLFSDL